MGPPISAAELAERLGRVRLHDVRYRMGGPPGRPPFEAGHLPGAVHADHNTELDADLDTDPDTDLDTDFAADPARPAAMGPS